MGEFFRFMGQFFRGWRRKLGVVTLVMACVFTAEWVRSLVYVDALTVIGNNGPFISRARIESNLGAIYFAHFRILDILEARYKRSLPKYSVVEVQNSRPPIDVEWTLLGFAMRINDTGSIGGFGIRYWSIVIPLAMLSACLLFGKPRSKKPPEST
jgi:hypothetical protein